MPGSTFTASADEASAPGILPYAVLLGAQAAIGAAALMARAGLADGLDPWSLSAWRLTIASCCVVPAAFLARRAGAAAQLGLWDRLRLVAAGFGLALHFAAWFYSLQHVTVAVSTLLVNTGPLWAGLGSALLLRECTAPRLWVGLAVAAPGVWLTARAGHSPPLLASGGSVAIAEAAAIVGAVAIAAYLLLVQDLVERVGTLRVVAWTYPAAALWLWPVALALSRGHLAPVSGHGWLAVLGLALFSQLLGHTAMNCSLRVFPAGAVAAASLLEPVIAALLAWPLLGESVTAQQAAGGAVLLVGVGLALTPRSTTTDEAPVRAAAERG